MHAGYINVALQSILDLKVPKVFFEGGGVYNSPTVDFHSMGVAQFSSITDEGLMVPHYQAESWTFTWDINKRVALIFCVRQDFLIYPLLTDTSQCRCYGVWAGGRDLVCSSLLCSCQCALWDCLFAVVRLKQINLISQNADIRVPNCSRKG